MAGLCAEVVFLLDKTAEEVSDGLRKVTEIMKMSLRGKGIEIRHLMVFYFGHAFCTREDGSTRMELRNRNLSLEGSIQKALRDAKLQDKVTWVTVADCCQEIDEFASGDSEDEIGTSNTLLSSQRPMPTGDTGHFAAALAYCLLRRPYMLLDLFSSVQALMNQLTFFRQLCWYDKVERVQLFPLDVCCEVLKPMSERQFKKFGELSDSQDLFFLTRWLCELTGNTLRDLALNPRTFVEGFEGVIRLLKDIVDQLEEKVELFKGNSWWRQLDLISRCEDLDEVLLWLQERQRPSQAVGEERCPDVCPITEAIQKCFLESFKSRQVKDVFDKWEEDVAPPHVRAAANLWRDLSDYFEHYHGKFFDTIQGQEMRRTYAIYTEGVDIEHADDSELRNIAEQINELSKKFDTVDGKYRIFMVPGSSWIIVRSVARLQLTTFMKSLTEWIEERRHDVRSRWTRATAPMRVRVQTVPQRFLRLVQQVENCLELGGCMWLRASDVRLLALEHLNKERKHGDELQEWQVGVFDGISEAKGSSWPLGRKMNMPGKKKGVAVTCSDMMLLLSFYLLIQTI